MRRATLALAGALFALVARAETATPASPTSPSAPLPPSLPTIAQRGSLRVGISPAIAPFALIGAEAEELRRLIHATDAVVHATDGRPVAGFDVDLAAAAARALHVRLEIILVDRFDQLLPGLVAGRYDVVMSGLIRTLERARTIAFSDPYFASGLELLVRDDNKVATVQELKQSHARVAVRGGTTAEAFARSQLGGTVVQTLPDVAAIFSAIEHRQADAGVMDYVSARDAAVRGHVRVSLHPLEDRRFTVEHFAFAVRHGDADWLNWLNLMLRETKASGEFHTVAMRYNAWFRSER
jgi:polar amino acid transport system substrate-binding protein